MYLNTQSPERDSVWEGCEIIRRQGLARGRSPSQALKHYNPASCPVPDGDAMWPARPLLLSPCLPCCDELQFYVKCFVMVVRKIPKAALIHRNRQQRREHLQGDKGSRPAGNTGLKCSDCLVCWKSRPGQVCVIHVCPSTRCKWAMLRSLICFGGNRDLHT